MFDIVFRLASKVVKKIIGKSQKMTDFISLEDWLIYYQSKVRDQNNNLQRDNSFTTYPKVSILILTYNNLIFNQLCLESVYANTTYPNFEVIVVDNASTDTTPDWLRQYALSHSNLRLILNSENKGFAGGNNQAAKIATGEFLIFLNNDTVVTTRWIELFLNHIKRDPQIGLIGPVTNSTGNEARIITNYNGPVMMEKFSEKRSEEMTGISFDIRMLAFYCVMTRKEQYEAIGGLDEQFEVGMFEDDDLAVRYLQQGLRVVCAEDVFIHHFQGVSFGKLNESYYQEIFEKNRQKYEKKWGRKWEIYKFRK